MTNPLNNKKKNIIGFINSCKAWGGGEKWHFEAARDLQASGYSIYFFCRPGSEIESRLQQAKIPTKPLRIHNLSFLNPFRILTLSNSFRQLGLTTLILNSPTDTKLAGPAARIAKIPNIIFRRGMPHPIRQNFYNRWLFNKVIHKVIANSQAVADSLDAKKLGVVPPEKLTIIPNGMEFSGDQNVQPLDLGGDSRLVLATAGRMVKQKNQRFLIDVAERLHIQGLTFQLLIAGSGELQTELEAAVAERNLRTCVRFPGFIEAIPSLLAATDIFLFPSLFEGSPNTLIEAAGAGLPVIASDIPPNREILPDNRFGRLIQLGDVEGFSAAIIELANNSELRKTIGAAAQTHVRTLFNLENAREKLEALL